MAVQDLFYDAQMRSFSALRCWVAVVQWCLDPCSGCGGNCAVILIYNHLYVCINSFILPFDNVTSKYYLHMNCLYSP